MRSRHGFTLVELLVVIAIVAILVALLIPAVQSAREAGRRITCANHLKQFTLAVSNYAAAHQERLPPTAMTFFTQTGRRSLPKGSWPCDSWSIYQSHSWRVAVLPFLEEQNLYDQFDFSHGTVSDANLAPISQVLPVFQCPSTPGCPRSFLQWAEGVSGRTLLPALETLRVGAWDYAIHANSEKYGDEYVIPAWYGTKNLWSRVARFEDRGQSCPWEIVYGAAKMSWVTDGLSKTSAAHELAYLPNLYNRNGFEGTWSSFGEPMSGKIWMQTHFTGWAQMFWSYYSAIGRPINERNDRDGRFAFHPGGVNEAFLDGSVRFLPESTDLKVLAAMVSRSAGDTFEVD